MFVISFTELIACANKMKHQIKILITVIYFKIALSIFKVTTGIFFNDFKHKDQNKYLYRF